MQETATQTRRSEQRIRICRERPERCILVSKAKDGVTEEMQSLNTASALRNTKSAAESTVERDRLQHRVLAVFHGKGLVA